MTHDWRALAPHRPISISEVRDGTFYVPRTGEGAEAISVLLNAGLERPIAIFGPAGSGKSTELAALAQIRGPTWVGPLIRLDKTLPYHESVSVDEVLDAITEFAISLARDKLHLQLSSDLQSARSPRGFDLLLETVREIRKASRQGVIALIVDGLEKASLQLAYGTLVQLERLRDEARIVVVVPTVVATGPSAAVLHDYQVISIGPVIVSQTVDASVTDKMAEQGASFLLEIAKRRLAMASLGELEPLLRAAAQSSGGLVRTFLQLLHSAALSAAMRGSRDPDLKDLKQAARDQTGFLLRLLKEGDTEALRAAHGTDGREVEIDRRVRFLANGLLLEYEPPRGPVVRVAPLLLEALGLPPGQSHG